MLIKQKADLLLLLTWKFFSNIFFAIPAVGTLFAVRGLKIWAFPGTFKVGKNAEILTGFVRGKIRAQEFILPQEQKDVFFFMMQKCYF